jgi:DNA-binding PadR family transcriptional regulator
MQEGDMGIGMSLLAILEEGPSYGFHLKNEFERRTGGIWALNVGQVYTTLGRLQRDGLVASESTDGSDVQKMYGITEEGRQHLRAWFEEPSAVGPPSRDELLLKLVMVARRGREQAADVIQAERRSAVRLLQEYTRLKQSPSEGHDLGWVFLLDSLIFATEARVRWLDACEARLSSHAPRRDKSSVPTPASVPTEVEELKS